MTMNHTIISALAALAVLASSCGKSEVGDAYLQQDKNIESLVKSLAPENSEATVEYIDGVVRVTVTHGEGPLLESDGTVSFLYAAHHINSSSLTPGNMFVTNSKEFAEASNWTVSDTTIFQVSTVNLAEESLVKGLEKGIVGVKAGDECYIMFNGKYGFGKHTVGVVPANSALAYHLWISSVSD